MFLYVTTLWEGEICVLTSIVLEFLNGKWRFEGKLKATENLSVSQRKHKTDGYQQTQSTLSLKHVTANFLFSRSKDIFSGIWGGNENVVVKCISVM